MTDPNPPLDALNNWVAGELRKRCEICGELLTDSSINGRCSPCFWARKTGGNPKDWKVPMPTKEKHTEAIKFDDGKLPLDLLPFEALEEIALVLQHGAIKYAPDNWRGGFIWSRTFSALLRHLFAFWRGEDIDPDSGLSHLAHAGCNLLFLISFFKTKTGTDNRYKETGNG